MSQLRLGVGICALNESAALPRLLSRLTSVRDPEDRADKVVVADGGSEDGTPGLAEAGGAQVLATGRGRGVQLRAAGEALLQDGVDVLLFLHADSVPRIGSLAAIRRAFTPGGTAKGAAEAAAMRQVIEAEGRLYRRIERFANARSRRGMVYGDSGLAVAAELYRETGGYAEIPLFEDVDLSKRIRRLRPIRLVESATLVISARRWKEEGLLRSSVRNFILRGLYECGVPPRTLLRMYRPFAGTKKSPSAKPADKSSTPLNRAEPPPPSPLNEPLIEARFEEYLKHENLKMTPQRRRVFEKAFDVHEHFSVERMYEWLKAEEGPDVSRATVYRTLEVLERGGFIEAVETGRGEVVYEHILGHEHHDHMVCRVCGTIAEFQDEEIEALQRKNAEKLGFIMTGHMLRLSGVCGDCAKKLRAEGTLDATLESL